MKTKSIVKALKESVAVIALAAVAFGSFGASLIQPAVAYAAAPNWNATGPYVIDMTYNGSDNPHDMSLTQDGLGNLHGSGGSPAGANTYTWVIDSGSVSGDNISFSAHYTATPDAVTPPTTLNVSGVIAADGTISGTWSDNYQGGARSGTVTTNSGHATATPVAPAASATTLPATGITSTDATLNGMNGPSDAQGHSFWASLAPFATDSSTLPAGVYSTPDLGAIAANATSSALLSSVNGLPAITPSTTYYFAAWSNVAGTWHPGSVLNFMTAASSTGTTTPPSTVKVTIEKFVDGMQATASSSMSLDFPMTATYSSTSTGSGTGTYNLSASGYNGDPTPYQAKTANMTYGANYSTNEITGGSVVGASCSTSQPYALVGYTTGNTLAEAMAATPTLAVPAFTGMTNDKFVIVWNNTCRTSGTIGGTSTGGTATSSPGTLQVTGVTAVKTTATADGTFANGWKYTFNITVPDNETHLAMKFADWMNTTGSSTIAAANNMRISSAQADNGGATVTVTAANAYTTPTLNMTGDLNPAAVGKQVQVSVEVAVPSTTVNGSYTTNYGVKTQ